MVVATWSRQCRCEGPCTFSRSPVWGGVGNKLESLLSNVKESDVLTIAFSSGNWLLLQMRGISHLLRSSGVNVGLQHLERRNTWSNPVFPNNFESSKRIQFDVQFVVNLNRPSSSRLFLRPFTPRLSGAAMLRLWDLNSIVIISIIFAMAMPEMNTKVFSVDARLCTGPHLPWKSSLASFLFARLPADFLQAWLMMTFSSRADTSWSRWPRTRLNNCYPGTMIFMMMMVMIVIMMMMIIQECNILPKKGLQGF